MDIQLSSGAIAYIKENGGKVTVAPISCCGLAPILTAVAGSPEEEAYIVYVVEGVSVCVDASLKSYRRLKIEVDTLWNRTRKAVKEG